MGIFSLSVRLLSTDGSVSPWGHGQALTDKLLGLTVQINTESTGPEDRPSYDLRGSAAVVLLELVRRL